MIKQNNYLIRGENYKNCKKNDNTFVINIYLFTSKYKY